MNLFDTLKEQAKDFARKELDHSMNKELFMHDVYVDKFAELIVLHCSSACLDLWAACAGLSGDGALAKDCSDLILEDFDLQDEDSSACPCGADGGTSCGAVGCMMITGEL